MKKNEIGIGNREMVKENFFFLILIIGTFFLFVFFMATPTAYENSQARHWIRATVETTRSYNPLCPAEDQTHISTVSSAAVVGFFTHCASVVTCIF